MSDPGDPAEQEARRLAAPLEQLSPQSRPRARPAARRHRQEQGSAPVSSEIAGLPVGLSVDNFESVYYDLDYRSEGGNLSKWLTAVYADGTVVDIPLDSIEDSTSSGVDFRNALAQSRVGDGGRVYPRLMNRSTTPRLSEAKRSALEAMDEFNVQFITATMPAVLFIIAMPLATGGLTRVPATRRAIVSGPRIAPARSVLGETLQQALRPNTMRHIFGKAKHGLDVLVKALGGEEAVVREAVRGLGRVVLPRVGPFEVVVTIAGRSVTLRGAVVSGVPRISTMFLRP